MLTRRHSARFVALFVVRHETEWSAVEDATPLRCVALFVVRHETEWSAVKDATPLRFGADYERYSIAPRTSASRAIRITTP